MLNLLRRPFTLEVAGEFIRGFRAMRRVGPAVTLFGSARFRERHPYYALGRRTGATFARGGYTVITGGGPGLMEAANRGARDAGGRSIGINIVLPYEQRSNPHLDRVLTFRHFFVRKHMMMRHSCGFVFLPGGYGTLDELSEVLVLLRTGKIPQLPVVLLGTQFWNGVIDWMRERLLMEGAISAEDFSLLRVTDDPDEALALISGKKL